MKFIKDTLAEAWKSIVILFKDKGELASLFIFPLMFATVIGYAFSGGGNGSPKLGIYLVDLDQDSYSEKIKDYLGDIESIEFQELDTIEEADLAIANGDRIAAIIIPEGLSDNIRNYVDSTITILVDPVQESYAGFMVGMMNKVVAPIVLEGEINYGIHVLLEDSTLMDNQNESTFDMIEAQITGVIWTRLGEIMDNPNITINTIDVEGREQEVLDSAFSYTFPSYAVMFAFFILGTIAQTLMAEKEIGTFRRLLASPMHRGAILAGKMLAYILVIFLQIAFIFAIGNIFFDISLGNSWLGLALITLGIGISSTSIGLLVYALAGSRSNLGAVTTVLNLALSALGGSLVMIPESGFLNVISRFTPHSHAIEGYLKIMALNATWIDILPQFGILCLIGLVTFLIAIWQFKFE